MLTDVVKFLPDIQSINPTENAGFALLCNTEKTAIFIRDLLLQKFGKHSILDIDNHNAHYIIPLEDLDEKNIAKLIFCGNYNLDRYQKFFQYLITVYNKDTANKIYNILIANGYNVVLCPNKMQLIVKCIDDSPKNTAIEKLKSELETFEKASPTDIDVYFNKILFNGVLENVKYHTIQEQKFDINKLKQNKDFIIREIVYRYFNTKIRAYLNQDASLITFDANNLDKKTIQSINLVRDFLYSVAQRYIDEQIDSAKETHQQPIVKFDYLERRDEYGDFKNVLRSANKWQRKTREDKKIKQHNIRMSQRHAYKLMDLNHGYYVVYLGAQEALNYENRTLKQKTEIHYDDDIYEGFARYSVRKEYTSFVKLTVYNNKVIKCCGYEYSVPYINDLREAVRTFMREFNFSIPDNSWNKLIAYIKQNGVVYDVLNLPKDFLLNETLHLEEMGLEKLPDMSTVTINGNFLCYGNKLSDLKNSPRKVAENFEAYLNPNLSSLRGISREIGGLILLPPESKLTKDSFVPLYLEEKLQRNEVLGPSEEILAAWKKQIADRKKLWVNIISSLRERN